MRITTRNVKWLQIYLFFPLGKNYYIWRENDMAYLVHSKWYSISMLILWLNAHNNFMQECLLSGK